MEGYPHRFPNAAQDFHSAAAVEKKIRQARRCGLIASQPVLSLQLIFPFLILFIFLLLVLSLPPSCRRLSSSGEMTDGLDTIPDMSSPSAMRALERPNGRF